MADAQQALENLRARIAKVIADLETWTTLYDVRDTLGLSKEDTDGLGKHKYLRKVTASTSDDTIILAAQTILTSYPGTRAKPSNASLQSLQDDLWWLESRGIQRISNVCRYRIVESLEGTRFWGRLTLREFFAPVIPFLLDMSVSVPDVGDDGYREHPSFVRLILRIVHSGRRSAASARVVRCLFPTALPIS